MKNFRSAHGRVPDICRIPCIDSLHFRMQLHRWSDSVCNLVDGKSPSGLVGVRPLRSIAAVTLKSNLMDSNRLPATHRPSLRVFEDCFLYLHRPLPSIFFAVFQFCISTSMPGLHLRPLAPLLFQAPASNLCAISCSNDLNALA
jgi:hypothetical protein